MPNDPVISGKYCPNCGNELKDVYCEKCGQKRIELKDRSVKSFAVHFIEELLTFDSKFFRSVKYLFIKPGYLTLEYISGRFINYISPLKMYLFTSLVTLFVIINLDPDQYKGLMEPRDDENIIQNYISSIEISKGLSNEDFKEKFNSHVNDMISISIFFIMVAFSLILKMIYFRKNIYYVEHLVFTLHFFSMVLIMFAVGALLNEISYDIIYFCIFILPCIYLLFSLKRVYHAKWIMALISCFFLSFIYWVLIIAWFGGTIIAGALRV